MPIDAVDSSSYLTGLEDAGFAYWWIFGNGAAPFVKQYRDYGLDAPLITAMASDLTEPQLADLGELGLGLLGGEFYSPEVDSPLNREFVDAYKAMYDGAYPTMQSFDAWLAINLIARGVEANRGDTTPAKLIEAMSSVTLETPAGPYKMSKYRDMYVGTGSYFMMETKQVGDRIAWVPIVSYDDLLHEQK